MKDLLDIIKKEYTIYIAGQKENIELMKTKPFGIKTKIINPFDENNEKFFDILNKLDGAAYGDAGMAMPKWVSHDCGMMPSAIIGLAKDTKQVSKETKNKLFIKKNYKGLVPITEFCAIPSLNGTWVAHTLATIEGGKGLGFATKVIGLKVYGAKKIQGVVQYDNTAIKTHTKINSLVIEQAVTPARTHPYKSIVYSCVINQDNLHKLLKGRHNLEQANSIMKAHYENSLEMQAKEMQQNIQTGKNSYKIVHPGMQIYFDEFQQEKKLLYLNKQ